MDNPQGDAAEEAFDQLRTEVALLRRAVEGLAAADERHEPVDYGPTLAKLASQLAAVDKRIGAVAQSPLLTLTPALVVADIQAAAARARQEAQGDWSRVQHGLDNTIRALGETLARARTGVEQRRSLIIVGASGVLVGVLLWTSLSGPVARALPDRWQVAERLAAATLKEDRWAAGSRMMHGASPQDWQRIVDMAEFERDNRKALYNCRQAAAKAETSQKCKVTVRPLTAGGG